MGKALIIAEKPSVAGDIARALGGFKRHDDFFESDRYVLSSAIGHLVEICAPAEFEAKRGKWTFPHLPVIPPRFDLQPIAKSESRLKLLTRLMKRKDVDELINACDAGREGELIFRYIVQYVGSAKPIQRLWLQSMTPAAIREGFERLRSEVSMRPLADAAVCRSESDWLVGINGTRVMTAFNSKGGGFQLTTVGRVQTPTLTILVDREDKIRKFVSKDYWEVHATFAAQAGEYVGRWFDEGFQKPKNGENADQRAERLWDLARAEAIRDKCLGKPGVATEESKPATQLSPLLYDLTTLQREANARFAFSATKTLALAQTLYERHKVLTYPRTDSRALPEDYLGTAKNTVQALQPTAYGSLADRVISNGWVRPNKRIFNNAKVSDHFAIIPTPLAPKHLNEAEARLYDMVVKRFLAVFFPAAEFLVTTRITRVEAEAFKSEGKVMVNPGWLAVYGRETQSDDSPALVPVQPGETVRTANVEVVANQTKPPPRFSEATLLSAMEGAGKLVEDEELREAMSAKGLGTPATRAAIIEGLIKEEYIRRHGKELQPTAKAFSLISLLRGLEISELCSPELTGDWEYRLRQMERGQLTRPDFMQQIVEMTRHIVERVKGHENDTIPGNFSTLQSRCPKCGGVVRENHRRFQCQTPGCEFGIWKVLAARHFELEEVEELIRKRVLGPLQGFRSRTGSHFAATLKLTPEFKVEFDFGENEKSANAQAEPIDFSGQEPVGKCPKCGSQVFESGASYVCEKAVGKGRACDFRSGRVILQQSVDRPQMAKLLATGKSDLLTHFVSRKTGRPFKAYLVFSQDGKVGFEFEPREAKAKTSDRRAKERKEPAAKLDFTGQEPLGKCPQCGGRVFESESQYLCEKGQDSTHRCKFRSGKLILHQPVDRAQMIKLLAEGKTDLLDKFISRRGKPFSAYLVLDEGGKVGFEFMEREGSAGETSGV